MIAFGLARGSHGTTEERAVPGSRSGLAIEAPGLAFAEPEPRLVSPVWNEESRATA